MLQMLSQLLRNHRPPGTDRLKLASVEITQRCNMQCPYCNQIKTDRDMPVSTFNRLLDFLNAEGFDAVALGGGEPTLHPDLPELLQLATERGLQTGLTTNCRATALVNELFAANLLDSFGVSAGKGEWLELAGHPGAIVNLLLLRGGLQTVLNQAVQAIECGAHCLLLLVYKGRSSQFSPGDTEVEDAFSLLTMLGRKSGITIAVDDYSRRRLQLVNSCGEGFVRINLDGTQEMCCFPDCEFRVDLSGVMG